MTAAEQISCMNQMPLVMALWWWIENVTADDPARSEVFFYLRERVRNEVMS